MASEVTVRKLTQGFMVSTPRTMRDGKPVEDAFAESTRPAMIQRVLKCLGIEPAECYLEQQNRALGGTVITTDPPSYIDDGEPFPAYRCANGACEGE